MIIYKYIREKWVIFEGKYKVEKTQETYKYYIVTTIGGSPSTKYTMTELFQNKT